MGFVYACAFRRDTQRHKYKYLEEHYHLLKCPRRWMTYVNSERDPGAAKLWGDTGVPPLLNSSEKVRKEFSYAMCRTYRVFCSHVHIDKPSSVICIIGIFQLIVKRLLFVL